MSAFWFYSLVDFVDIAVAPVTMSGRTDTFILRVRSTRQKLFYTGQARELTGILRRSLAKTEQCAHTGNR